MGLFGKKKKSKEEEELEDDEEEDEDELEAKKKKKLEERKKFSRKLKDLNSEDAKKRKEPPKPWTYKERLWVIVFMVITVGISGFLALGARNYKLPGLPRLKFNSNFLSSIFKGETIVIEGDKKDNGKSVKVLSEIEDITKNLSGIYGVYVVRLNDESNYGVNEDEVFQAASLIKLPVMIGMYQEAESGRISLESKYKLKEGDKLGGAGSLYNKPIGYEITYRNLIRLMAKESDNTAFNVCRKLLGDERIEAIIDEMGMTKTSLTENETTPRDIGILLKQLWDESLINSKNTGELLGYMTNTLYEKWLPKGISGNVKIAHKVGIETHIINDAGIIYSGNNSNTAPYILTVMSKGIVEKQADESLPEISKLVFDAEAVK